MKIMAIDPGSTDSAYVVVNESYEILAKGKIENEHKLYAHIFPNGKIYIGITKLVLNNRWKNGKGYKNAIFVKRAIEKYGWDNIKHKLILDKLSKDEAQRLEIEYISKFKSNNKEYGYNIESGGNLGSVGLKRSAETIQKMRMANLGKIMKLETKLKISESLKGRSFTPEQRIKRGEAQKGIKNHRYGTTASDDTKRKMSDSQIKGGLHRWAVKVKQLDINTEVVIKEWECINDICKELKVTHSCISDCCRGEQKTSKGFKWRYVDDK